MPQLLDVVTVPLGSQAPHTYQTENHQIDSSYYWVKQGTFQIAQLAQLCDSPRTLWLNGYHSHSGYNDRIPVAVAQAEVTSSLLLIKPTNLRVKVFDDFGDRHVRGLFNFGRVLYNFAVTDPKVEGPFRAGNTGLFPVDNHNLYVCISLGEPYQGFCYKLIAGVVPGL